MIGQTISHYRILEEIDRRGIGIVYRAEDMRLGRQVAIKLFPPELSNAADAVAQFEREARLASSLNHPNICTVHDMGEHAGRPFIVMELLQGGSLRSLMSGDPLAPARAVDIGIQIAEALGAAHQRGIVHRDVRPGNAFVTTDDQVKLLDFGLAKLVHEGRADADISSSSPTASRRDSDPTNSASRDSANPYMSPEQARGEPVDARSDLFSLGAVLYEMATGHRAFPGLMAAVVYDAILNRNPTPAIELNTRLAPGLDRILDKALEKDRELRYQDAADLVADLRRVRRRMAADAEDLLGRGDSSGSRTRTRIRSGISSIQLPAKGKRWMAATGAMVVALLVAMLIWFNPFRSETAALSERDSVLLADFANTTGDAVFDGTLRQGLAAQLSQSPFLNLVPEERVGETLRLMSRPTEERLTHDVAREVCQRLNVKAMLEGGITLLGSLYVVTLEATNCQTGESLAREQVEVESKERVLKAIGGLSSAMRQKLGESLASIERFDVPIEQATTPSLEALRAYTLGTARRARGSEIESIPFFERAIEIDPQFASAYTTLSTVYGNLGETARSAQYAQLAYQYREHVSERERLFLTVQYHDRVTEDQLKSIETLEVWKQSFPRDYRAPNSLAVALNRLGQFDRAIEEASEAMRRNPSHPFPYSNLAYAYRGANRYDESRATGERTVALKIETLPTRRLLYQLAVLRKDQEEAKQHLDWAADRPQQFDLIGAEAQVAAFEGRMRDARALYQRTIEMARQRNFAEIGTGYAAMAAWTDAVYGYADRARQTAETLIAGNPTMAPRLRGAAALATAGGTVRAQTVVNGYANANRTATILRTIYLPIAEAAIALQRRDPDRAITLLDAAAPYEMGLTAGAIPAYQRGEALRMKGLNAEAAAQYQAVLDHRGSDPFSPVYPLSMLGVARATAGSDPAAARRAYEGLFELWARADDDLPALGAARVEYERLARDESGPAAAP